MSSALASKMTSQIRHHHQQQQHQQQEEVLRRMKNTDDYDDESSLSTPPLPVTADQQQFSIKAEPVSPSATHRRHVTVSSGQGQGQGDDRGQTDLTSLLGDVTSSTSASSVVYNSDLSAEMR